MTGDLKRLEALLIDMQESLVREMREGFGRIERVTARHSGMIVSGTAAITTLKSTTKLPESYHEAPDRYLRDLAIGEAAYVGFTTMRVDNEGYCYLNPDGEIRPGGRMSIRVERRADGYHVGILSGQCWQLGVLLIGPDFFPVASLTDVGERWGNSR